MLSKKNPQICPDTKQPTILIKSCPCSHVTVPGCPRAEVTFFNENDSLLGSSLKFWFLGQKSLFPDFDVFHLANSLILSDAPAVVMFFILFFGLFFGSSDVFYSFFQPDLFGSSDVPFKQASICPSLLWFCLLMQTTTWSISLSQPEVLFVLGLDQKWCFGGPALPELGKVYLSYLEHWRHPLLCHELQIRLDHGAVAFRPKDW